jgi:TPR repeat protein
MDLSIDEIAKCARAGDANAQFTLARHFLEQREDSDSSYLAADWFLAAAKNGNVEAQYQIGLMYLDGHGVTDDAIEGFEWIAEAAKKGHPAANEVFNYLLENPQPMEC